MIDLGRITIKNNNNVIEARKKIKQVAYRLGCSPIMCTRIEAVISEIAHIYMGLGNAFDMNISLNTKHRMLTYIIEFKHISKSISLPFANEFFDEVSSLLQPDKTYIISVAKYLKDLERDLESSEIDLMKADVNKLSREELMEEITHKKNELESSSRFMDAVLENIQAAVYVKNLLGQYTYVNSQWEKVTGLEKNMVIGKTAIDLFDREQGEIHHQYDMDVIAHNEKMMSEEEATIDNEVRVFLSTKVQMRQDDQIIGLCSISTDITDRKKLEEDMLEAQKFAEDAAKSKSDFLANMSHEIRTPMNAIMGMAFLIQKTELSEKQSDYVHKIHNSSQHLLGIINDILDFSKIEAGKLNVEKVDFKLESLLENVLTLIGEKCASKGLELIFDIGPSIPNNMIGDPLRLGQILINYANNAVKFTEKGEIIISIQKESELENGDLIKFMVKDTGIGLKEEQKNKLFQSFQQADASTTRKYGGTGLGLAISKELASLMNGAVGVDSVYGKGSTFWFTAVIEENKEKKSIVLSDLELSDRRVLVVDDNQQARMILSEMLTMMTFRVESVDSGEASIKSILKADAEDDPYELVYMDMQMPVLNGIETMVKINKLQLLNKLKCIMVTGFGREDVFNEANKVGIDVILNKPVSASTLFESSMAILGVRILKSIKVPEHESESDYINELSTIKGAKILLVEDNEINQEVAIGLLEEGNFMIDIASDGEMAIEFINKKVYDLVLMDMQMPIMGGVEATSIIRENAAFDALPILAMTANAMSQDRDKCIEVGMNDHISKPIEPKDLYGKLLKWIPVKCEKNVKRCKNAPVNKLTLIDFSVPKLNIEAGLKCVLGKEKTYLKLLKKYIESQRAFKKDITKAFDEGDYSRAELLAHTLKGVSGNIGACEIQHYSGELESAIKRDLSRATISELTEKTSDVLKKMIDDLEKVLPKKQEKSISTHSVASKDELLVILEALKPVLEKKKPKRCIDIIKSNVHVCWPENLKVDYDAFKRLILKYKYKDALKALKSLQIKLEEVDE